MRFFLILLIFLSTKTWAQSEEPVQPNGEIKDIDLEITNAKMRAESGSKSKWSIKADISYNGGNLEEPFGEVRPNYAGVSSQDNSTSIAGTVAVAYRWSVADTLRAGTGILVLTPFHNTWEELTNSSGVRKTDISNPYLEYARAMRIGRFQNIFDTYYMQYTQSAYTEANYVGLYDINHTVLYKFEPTEWELGLVTDLSYIFFSDTKDPTDTLTNPVNGRTDYTIGLYPFVEYAFSGRYSFRTVFRFLTFDHYRADEPWTFYRQLYTQSVGLGIAITRDVYLYPNIQFAPEHLSPERTNVGLNTTINIF